MQDVEENRGPGQIFTMSSLAKPKLSSADMADISINVICCDSCVVGDFSILRSKSRITKKTFCELLDKCQSFQIYIHSPSCCLHVNCNEPHGIIDFWEDWHTWWGREKETRSWTCYRVWSVPSGSQVVWCNCYLSGGNKWMEVIYKLFFNCLSVICIFWSQMSWNKVVGLDIHPTLLQE